MISSAPTHLYKDRSGKIYSPQFKKVDGQKEFTTERYYLIQSDFDFMEKYGAKITYLPDIESDKEYEARIGSEGDRAKNHINSCANAPTTALPASASIYHLENASNVIGNISVCNTSPNTALLTQGLSYQIRSYNYALSGSHLIAVTWFRPPLHGQGMYYGWGGGATCSNGQVEMNTRMESWSQYEGHVGQGAPYWVSTGNSESGTCRNTVFDNWYSGLTYRVNLEANNWGNRAYSVDRWTGSNWIIHSPLIVNAKSFSSFSGSFDFAARGASIGGYAEYAPYWYLQLSNIVTYWY